MKKIIMTTTAIAAVAFATPAFAQSTQDLQTATFTVSGLNPAKCQINADDVTAELGDDEISNEQGRARNNVGSAVARALNELEVRAWCTGAKNKIVLTRTPLATGDGEQTTGPSGAGFNQAVIYDIAVLVPGYDRTKQGETEATEDGDGGPEIGRFGPDGRGARLRFSNYSASANSDAVNSDAPGAGSRDSYSGLVDNSRLVAGDYVSTVVLTLNPGV